ncbi:MAG: GntR family transcriptional regulator [Polyangiaceae bacterium]
MLEGEVERGAREGEVERVARELLAAIVSGRYPPGVRLPAETELASELGCGRSTVREALSRLATLGVVASRRGSGARVLDWRRDGTPALLPTFIAHAGERDLERSILELLNMRRLLAKEAVRLAVRYASDAAIAQVRAAFEASKHVTDPAEHVMAELEIFRGLVIASALWPAVWFANAFWGPMRELHARYAPLAGGPPPDYAPSTARLLDLVAARDERGAIEQLDQYLGRVDSTLVELLGGSPEKPAPKKTKQKERTA